MRIKVTYRNLFPVMIGFLLLFGACQKVVRLDLQDAERVLVVEAMLRAGPISNDSTQTINLKRTSAFYQQGQDPVQAATVIVQSPGGRRDTLLYDANGDYIAANFLPLAYETYSLRIEDEEEVYTSGIIFPEAVQIDSILVDVTNNNLGLAVVAFNDPPNIPNYYRIRHYRSGESPPRQYNLLSDEDPDKDDGGYLAALIFLGGGFQSGDTIVLELQSLDEGSYHFFKDLNKSLNSNSTVSAPYNPRGNILGDGDALGYFGGMAVDTVWYIVQ
jgi:hypothetical protein